VVVVASTNKIVSTKDDAVKRLHDFCFPLENARAKIVYKMGSGLQNSLVVHGANPFAPKRYHVILVKELHGY
jgi:hypothetical protein